MKRSHGSAKQPKLEAAMSEYQMLADRDGCPLCGGCGERTTHWKCVGLYFPGPQAVQRRPMRYVVCAGCLPMLQTGAVAELAERRIESAALLREAQA